MIKLRLELSRPMLGEHVVDLRSRMAVSSGARVAPIVEAMIGLVEFPRSERGVQERHQ